LGLASNEGLGNTGHKLAKALGGSERLFGLILKELRYCAVGFQFDW
jgi:hypothetical protein